jgi:phosphoglycerate kinase
MKKMTVKDVDIAGKRLLMRVDFNIPMDEKQNITDDKRIKASLPTIKYAVEKGARLILMSHLGRPKKGPHPTLSLKPAAVRLGEMLGKEVIFAPDCIGPEVEALAAKMKNGDVMLLENVRFHPEEEKNDPEFSKNLSRLGEMYANDAFGSAHRAHSSTVGVAEFYKVRVSGFLMEKELEFLGQAVGNPKRPFISILGGAKVSDKIPVIKNMIDKVDTLIIGGGMAYTFLAAMGKEIGKSILDKESLDFARELCKTKKDKILLPVDCLITDIFKFEERTVGQTKVVSVDQIDPSWQAVDIGPKTIELFSDACQKAKTVMWNGPLGVFEIKTCAEGTFSMAKTLAELTKKGVTTIIGGGDTASAVKKAGVAADMSHVSTGGGASLEFLEGRELPGVSVLTNV